MNAKKLGNIQYSHILHTELALEDATYLAFSSVQFE